MASKDKDGKIRGKIDNVVYRDYKGKQIMQIAPSRVKQTLSTKLSALEFGLAAKIGKNIRGVFHNVYEKYDGPMVRRLTAAIAACIRTSGKEIGERDLHDADLSQLRGFTFNKDALFEKLVAVRPILDVAPNGRIQFYLPPFVPNSDIVYPPDLFRPNGSFGIYVVAFDFRDSYVHVIDYVGFDFEGDKKEAKEISWTCNKLLPKGYIVFVVLCLRYFSLNWLNQRVQTTANDFYPTIFLDAFHVTDEMVSLGIADRLLTPSKDELSGLEKINMTLFKQKTMKLKEKATKK